LLTDLAESAKLSPYVRENWNYVCGPALCVANNHVELGIGNSK
jgi:hypothetical protein